ncbi:MAG: phosphoenolpyruvate carboxykinase (ATP), partial [Marivirga sp.]|nr:phosphoenolpyruvate carboxykinase (ATP) [Marivirga sp.]
MLEFGIRPSRGGVTALGLTEGKAHWNLSPEQLSMISLDLGMARMTSSEAVAIDTGEFTGRSPKDKFTVRDEITEHTVWWNTFNIPFEPGKFEPLYKKVLSYLNGKEIYVRDVYACADPRYRMNIRVITEYAWSNLFVHNMF